MFPKKEAIYVSHLLCSRVYCIVYKKYTIQFTKQHTVKCTTHVKYKKKQFTDKCKYCCTYHSTLKCSKHCTVHRSIPLQQRQVGRCMFLWNQGISASHFGIGGEYSVGYSVQHTIQCTVQYTLQCPGYYGVQCQVKFTGSKEGNVSCGVSQPNQAL